MITDLVVHRQLALPVMQEERGMQLQARMTGSKYMKHMAAAVVCAVLVLCCAPVYAGTPMEQLKVSFDKALGILSDVSLKAPEMRQQRRDMLREVANCMFAWEEMSKRSMGTYWRERTPEERNDFIKLFSSFTLKTEPCLLAFTTTDEPQLSLQITGVPCINASLTTAPQPSNLLGKTKQSDF